MCGFYFITFIKYMLSGIPLLDLTNFFSPYNNKKNNKLICKCFKNNIPEKASFELRLRKIVEPRNYLLYEIKHNDLMSKKDKKTCKYLNYVEYLMILVSTVTGCVSISTFASLVAIHVRIIRCAPGIKVSAITAGIKEYKSILKKKKKKHDKIVLLGKDKLNTTEVAIFKPPVNLYIRHDEFVLIKNVLRAYNEMLEEINLL